MFGLQVIALFNKYYQEVRVLLFVTYCWGLPLTNGIKRGDSSDSFFSGCRTGNTSEYLFCSFLYHFFKNQPPLRHLSRVEFFISLSFLHFFFHAIACNLMYMYITFIYLYRLFFLDHNKMFYDIFSFLVQPINKTQNCI